MKQGCRLQDWDLPPRRQTRPSSAGTSPSHRPRSSSWPRWRGPGHHPWCPSLRQLHREPRETFCGVAEEAGTKELIRPGQAQPLVFSTSGSVVSCQFHWAQPWLACFCWLSSGVVRARKPIFIIHYSFPALLRILLLSAFFPPQTSRRPGCPQHKSNLMNNDLFKWARGGLMFI